MLSSSLTLLPFSRLYMQFFNFCALCIVVLHWKRVEKKPSCSQWILHFFVSCLIIYFCWSLYEPEFCSFLWTAFKSSEAKFFWAGTLFCMDNSCESFLHWVLLGVVLSDKFVPIMYSLSLQCSGWWGEQPASAEAWQTGKILEENLLAP